MVWKSTVWPLKQVFKTGPKETAKLPQWSQFTRREKKKKKIHLHPSFPCYKGIIFWLQLLLGLASLPKVTGGGQNDHKFWVALFLHFKNLPVSLAKFIKQSHVLTIFFLIWERKINSLIDSLLQSPQQPGLDQIKTRYQEINPCLPCGRQERKYLKYSLLLPHKICMNRKQELRAWATHSMQALGYRRQALSSLTHTPAHIYFPVYPVAFSFIITKANFVEKDTTAYCMNKICNGILFK